MTAALALNHPGWAVLAVSSLMGGLAWGLSECDGRRQAEAALVVERTLSESRATLDKALSQARAVAAAERVAIEAGRAIVEAVARAEESAAAVDVGRAEADERAILDELRATGRVTESARRSWERWRAQVQR